MIDLPSPWIKQQLTNHTQKALIDTDRKECLCVCVLETFQRCVQIFICICLIEHVNFIPYACYERFNTVAIHLNSYMATRGLVCISMWICAYRCKCRGRMFQTASSPLPDRQNVAVRKHVLGNVQDSTSVLCNNQGSHVCISGTHFCSGCVLLFHVAHMQGCVSIHT